jgi:hypothetical protein
MSVEKKPGGLYVFLGVAISLWIMAGLCACPGCWFWERHGGGGNEASAISALRTLSSAQELYKTRNGVYGDCDNLNDGASNKYIDEALRRADPDTSHAEGHIDKAGYSIDISVSADNSDWCAIAMPGNWGRDGERNFMITSKGIIYYNSTERSVVLVNVLGGP